MTTALNPLKSKISRALVIYVLLFSSAITLVLTAIQLYNDYRYDLSLIDSRLDQIQISNLDSLAQNLWTLNDDAIRLQLEGLLKLPDVVYLEVIGIDGELLASVGVPRDSNIVERAYPVQYQYRGLARELGSLRAVATLENVYQRLLDTFIVILITQGIKTFLVSAFIVFIVTQIITRHLAHLSQHAQRLNPSGSVEALRLDRKTNRMNSGDELDRLVSSYNAMQNNIRRSYAELAYSEDMLDRAQQIAHLCSWEIPAGSSQVRWSKESRSIIRCDSLGERDGLDGYLECVHPDDRERLRAGLARLEEDREPLYLEHRLLADDGEPKMVEFRAQFDADPETGGQRLIGTVHDVTEHCRQRDALHQMANFDSLTGLPNRWLLGERLEQAIAIACDCNGRFLLALLDLDGFKEVNDSLGHQAGDELLRQIKPRLEALLREGDTLARLGGDEFAVVLSPLQGMAEGIDIVNAIAQSMSEPFDLNAMQVKIGVSIGISLFPDHAGDGSTLLRYSDVAMYYAKHNKLNHTIYSAEIDPHTPRRLELISDLGRAISEDQLILHYQPKIQARSGKLEGVEALVRWQHPAHGFISPDEFLPLCELSDIIRPLTLWVLRRALDDQRRWRSAGFDIGVSVNVSVRNMLDSQFPDEVISILDERGVDPGTLTLEITENALMEDPRRAQTNIDALHRVGVSIAIDDFGTGYSSLAYLKHLPVQELKIDRGFVLDMLNDENDAVIVRSTVDLAHSLGIKVTAEGVENAAVTQRLQQMGCDHMQGFHFARPMVYAALESWFRAWSGFSEGADEGRARVEADPVIHRA